MVLTVYKTMRSENRNYIPACFKNLAGYSFLNTFILIAVLAFATSCKEEDPAPATPVINNTENQYVNNWIYQNMKYYYFWNGQLPATSDKNLSPDDYFPTLLNKDDRFSWINSNYQELVNSLQGINKESGIEFVLYRDAENSSKVVAQLLYVKPGSPADNAGLKRGDVITQINAQTITTDNYRILLDALKENHSIVYKPIIVGEDSFEAEKSVSLSTVEYTENPNYLSKVITAGDKKIGYYVYNFFASGPGSKYDNEMDEVFNTFKSQGVTDLVLDLRFNSGGSELSAKNLASLIGPGVNASKVFMKKKYNPGVEKDILNDPKLGAAFLTSNFNDEVANIGSQLAGGRVYILTSSRTASASELIINSLDPYMDVFLIGDLTYGKNVGSISIFEENDPKNKWGLQPIIMKVSNSVGFSEYGNGFVPDIENKDNSLYLYPLGDPRENLLAEAIAHITGVSTGGRVSAAGNEGREVISTSFDKKQRSFRLMMEENIPSMTR